MAFPKVEGYVVTERIGSGSYSTVYKAYNKVGGRTTVAIKCVDKSRVKQSGAAVDNLITEISLMKKLTHKHIVKMHDFTWDDKNIYIILEYCSGGDLSKYIHKSGRVPERQVRYFLQQLASALKFLREKGVVHMDLKPHNLLLQKGMDGKYVLKVADFGFACHLSAWSGGSVRGSPLYMAPEMVKGGPTGPEVDLWSVGVIMFECLFGCAPYSSTSLKELVDKIQRHTPIQIPPNSSISSGCRALLLSLLKHDPRERISYEEFFDHEYLDLEHMPTPENYEKGVSLINRAVEVDALGQYPLALELYKAGLRYLVARGGTPQEMHTITRYMDRAEAIKEYLKSQNNRTTDYNETTNDRETTNNRETTSSVNGVSNDVNLQESEVSLNTAQHNNIKEQSPIKSKSTLKRLFSRTPPVMEETTNEASQSDKNQREDNDTCRIT